MAHLWVSDSSNQWTTVALNHEVYDLRHLVPLVHLPLDQPEQIYPAEILLRTGEGAGKAWAVMAGLRGDLYINGHPVVAGIAVLADRDAILLRGNAPIFFSTETLATVEEFTGAERPIFCGRCHERLEIRKPAVRCPTCEIWYHQSPPDFPCWTYADKCCFCGRLTALDSEFAWVPDES